MPSHSETDEHEPEKLIVDPGVAPVSVQMVRSRFAIDGPRVHGQMFYELLEAAVAGAMKVASISDAWQKLFKPDDIIGLKFNQSGQAVLATTTSVSEIVVDSIVRAGFDPRKIVCIESPRTSQVHAVTTPPIGGYDSKPTEFGSGRDQLARTISQVTAIVNIPYLKTHNIAGLTGALKNLSHGLVKHPARYHANGCCPFIADINLLPIIREKVRLCIVDALRVVYDGGPDANAGTVSNEGVLLATTDSVAADAVGLTMLNDIRAAKGLREVAKSPAHVGYLADAHRKGLGVAARHGIRVINNRLS